MTAPSPGGVQPFHDGMTILPDSPDLRTAAVLPKTGGVQVDLAKVLAKEHFRDLSKGWTKKLPMAERVKNGYDCSLPRGNDTCRKCGAEFVRAEYNMKFGSRRCPPCLAEDKRIGRRAMLAAMTDEKKAQLAEKQRA